jgi:hypothetical protein
MIDVTPFYNPFKPVERINSTEVVETVVKNGKIYKRVVKK